MNPTVNQNLTALRTLMEGQKGTIKSTVAVYLRHESGATHELKGARFKKLRKEILAGRGGPEVTDLVSSGYVGFMADDGNEYGLEDISPETFAP